MCYFQSASVIRYILIRAKNRDEHPVSISSQTRFYVVSLTQRCHCVCVVWACVTTPSTLLQHGKGDAQCVYLSKVGWTCQHLQDTKSEIQTCAKCAHFKMCSALLFDTGNHFLSSHLAKNRRDGTTELKKYNMSLCNEPVHSAYCCTCHKMSCFGCVMAWKLNWHIMSLSRTKTCVWGLPLVDS